MSRASQMLPPLYLDGNDQGRYINFSRGYALEFVRSFCRSIDNIADLLILAFVDKALFESLGVVSPKPILNAYAALKEIMLINESTDELKVMTSRNAALLKELLLEHISTEFRLNNEEGGISISKLSGDLATLQDRITREDVISLATQIQNNRIVQAEKQERARQAEERERDIAEQRERDIAEQRERAIAEQRERAIAEQRARSRAEELERVRRAEEQERARAAELERARAAELERAQAAERERSERRPPPYLDHESPPPYFVFPEGTDLQSYYSDDALLDAIKTLRSERYTTAATGEFKLTFERSEREKADNIFCRPNPESHHLGIKIKIYDEGDRYKISFLKSREGNSSRERTQNREDLNSLQALQNAVVDTVRELQTPSTAPEPGDAGRPAAQPSTHGNPAGNTYHF